MNRIIRAADALGIRMPRNARGTLAKVAALLIALTGLVLPSVASAVTLGTATLTLSDPQTSKTNVNYTFKVGDSGAPVTSSAIKCVKIVYATTASDTAGTTAPTGFSDSGATTGGLASSTLVNSSATGWSVAVSGAGNNVLKYTNSTGVTPSTTTGATFVDDKVTNSSVGNTAYWAFFNTYGNTDCATSPIDTTTIEFINTDGSLMSLTVDNTLSFTVNGISASTLCGSGGNTTGVSASSGVTTTGTTIPFTTVSTNAIACQKLTAATNATGGYTIYIRDNGQMANTLGQKIPDVGGSTCAYTGNGHTNAAPGSFTNNTSSPSCTTPNFNQGAYGYTTSDTTLGTGTANRFNPSGTAQWAAYGHSTDETANAEVAYEPNGVTSTDTYIAHQVGVTALTQPGTYSTTVIYTCVPVY